MSNEDVIEVRRADITTVAVDAIVNAANESLLGGGGVDGAIHRAAGPALLAACRALPEVRPGVRCPTGAARITPGFALPATWVIHTVGPVWRGGDSGEPALLAACYRESLRLAAAERVASLAFPAISCGVYGYPAELASRVAVRAVRDWLVAEPMPRAVAFCCPGAAMARAFEEALAAA
jgi:O-acetyl-ADP-ribose deacetylase (regulator of RNase III)